MHTFHGTNYTTLRTLTAEAMPDADAEELAMMGVRARTRALLLGAVDKVDNYPLRSSYLILARACHSLARQRRAQGSA